MRYFKINWRDDNNHVFVTNDKLTEGYWADMPHSIIEISGELRYSLTSEKNWYKELTKQETFLELL
jgi:hypothetical protein